MAVTKFGLPLFGVGSLIKENRTLEGASRNEQGVEERLVIHNYYQLNPQFQSELPAARLLLLEPSVFTQYPISANCVEFMLSLASEIAGIKVFVGEFDALMLALEPLGDVEVVFQEHPLNRHYRGAEIARDWLAPEVEGSFSSFFSYWKKVEKSLRKEYKEVRGY